MIKKIKKIFDKISEYWKVIVVIVALLIGVLDADHWAHIQSCMQLFKVEQMQLNENSST